MGNVGIILVDESERVNVGDDECTLLVVVGAAAGCKVVMFSSGSPDELLPTNVEIRFPVLETFILEETSILEPDKKNDYSVMMHASIAIDLTIFL